MISQIFRDRTLLTRWFLLKFVTHFHWWRRIIMEPPPLREKSFKKLVPGIVSSCNFILLTTLFKRFNKLKYLLLLSKSFLNPRLIIISHSRDGQRSWQTPGRRRLHSAPAERQTQESHSACNFRTKRQNAQKDNFEYAKA